ncbi:hypothetical protein [Acetobacter senegalensis]|uniref:hypothetical protein n=1 Tax=Acetobacter senegalensis TaxID=446692 RepID=UPI00264FEB03|nr:hypothetical protein [Acetobacter senegalensis]MDN7354345.1 hypothetical protein [Acetobacter senegalensis]
MLLKDFETDSAVINDGKFVKVDGYDELEIKTRGYTDAYLDARTRRLKQAAEKYDGDIDLIPNGERRQINGELLRDYLVLDVKGVWHDKEKQNPVTADEFRALLGNPSYDRLTSACWRAVGLVQVAATAQQQDAEGN